MTNQIGVGNFAKHDERFPYKYRAKVMDNMDPLFYGRIRAKVYPMMAGIEDTEEGIATLPWAVPEFPLGSGAGVDPDDESYGTFWVPEIGTWVWVFFEMGDIYQPVYSGCAPAAISGLPLDAVLPTNPEDYPAVKVIRTKNKIQIKINDFYKPEEGVSGTSGYSAPVDHRDIRVDHPAGSWVEFFPDGRVTLHTTVPNGVSGYSGDITIEADAANIHVLAKEGNIDVIANEGDIDVTADKGDITVTASESDIVMEVTKGDMSVNVAEGDLDVTVGLGDTTVQAGAGNIDVVAYVGDITVEATVGNVTVEATTGDVAVEATAGAVDVKAGMTANVEAVGAVIITGATVSINPI